MIKAFKINSFRFNDHNWLITSKSEWKYNKFTYHNFIDSLSREIKDLNSEFGSPSKIAKMSPIVNRQAHKVHIVKKLEPTEKSVKSKDYNQQILESLSK